MQARTMVQRRCVMTGVGAVLMALAAAVGAQPLPSADQITDVHVVFSNHLDVGFDGIDPTLGFSKNVVNRYFDVYFPRAIATANAMRAAGTDRYIWMTQSWLVSFYLDCPPGMGLHCPTTAQQQDFAAAIMRGDITYHAWPFNSEMELCDQSMAHFGFDMTHALDDALNRTHTTVMSQRDVPGTTRSLIPILKQHGIEAISFGVNGFSSPPAFPKAFVWRDSASGTDVIGMLHPGGYGDIYYDDACIVPGFNQALIMAWRGDNAGPAEPAEVVLDYAVIRAEFPNARVFASTFDAFVQELRTVRGTLPVYNSEAGDTWIQGVASDPVKLAAFRAVMRERADCIIDPNCDSDSYAFANFSRLLLKNSEHTWGGDVKKFLNVSLGPDASPYYLWSNADFHAALSRKEPHLVNMVASWYEQRDWGLTFAIEALPPDHGLRVRIVRALAELVVLRAPDPVAEGFQPVSFGQTFNSGYLTVGFSALTGAINTLWNRNDPGSGSQWADEQHPLGRVVYQTFNETDFIQFTESYGYCTLEACPWALFDFGKNGVNAAANPSTQTVSPSPQSLWRRVDPNDGTSWFLVELTFDERLVADYGAPASMWVRTHVVGTNGALDKAGVHVVVEWFNKTSTRLPEALWLQYTPKPQSSDTLRYDVEKMGELVDVLDIVTNGSTHLHGAGHGGWHASDDALGLTFGVSSRDAALVSFGAPSPFPTPLGVSPDLTQGASFCLYNNIWGTNYVMWLPFGDAPEDANARYRFFIDP